MRQSRERGTIVHRTRVWAGSHLTRQDAPSVIPDRPEAKRVTSGRVTPAAGGGAQNHAVATFGLLALARTNPGSPRIDPGSLPRYPPVRERAAGPAPGLSGPVQGRVHQSH